MAIDIDYLNKVLDSVVKQDSQNWRYKEGTMPNWRKN